jgi:hypothetical protein
VGKITYIYQVSTSSSFSSILMTSPAVAEGSGQTAWTPTSDLPLTVFWRVQAKDDTNGEASSFTGGFSLTVQPFDPTKAIFIYNPPDLGSWPQTSTITYIEFGDGIFSFDFDRRDGNNAWPDVGFGSDGSLEYTLGLCEQINNQWYCSAAIQYWNGRDPYVTSDIAGNWFYDPQRWGILAGRQPQDGELVAIYVAQGNLRGPGYTYQERSDFVVMPWGGSYDRH